jgi:hypothetical protein
MEIQYILCSKRKLRNGTVTAQNFSCMRTITSFLFAPAEQSLRIQHALDETSDQPNYFDSEIKPSVLATAAANVHLARATRAVRVDGNYPPLLEKTRTPSSSTTMLISPTTLAKP